MKKAANKKQLLFMKKIILGCALSFLTLSITAQQGINYKALIKDNAGNVVADDLIVVQFSILKGTAQTNVYTETNSPTTTANGLIILNIGEGTVVSGDFTTIDWGSDDHFLNVQVNIGAGLTDMGTTAFSTVPYAIHTKTAEVAKVSETAETAENVKGLEKITENGKTGWRLVGRNPNNYGDIGINAIDLSDNFLSSSTWGATGSYSIAMGEQTTASGGLSTAMGQGTTASGDSSTAMGHNANASGRTSIAMGDNITAETFAQTTLGRQNTPVTGDIYNFVLTDRLFVIGNGVSSSNKSDAMVVLKNGNTTINGDFTINGNYSEVNATDSGSADMKAYIYGLVKNTGVIDVASSDGFTITKTGTGAYTVHFNNSPGGYNKYIVVTSLYGSNGIGFIKVERQSSTITINTYNISGVLADQYFSFVVYKK